MAAKTLFDSGVSAKLFLDQRQFYPEPNKVAEMYSDVTPFKTFLMKLGVKPVDDVLYKLFENESTFVKRECTTTTATAVADSDSASSALTLTGQVGLPTTVATSYNGMVFEVWDSTKTTKRGLAVATYSSTSAITLKLLGGDAFTTVSGDYLIYQFRIRGEGSVALEAESKQPAVVWNSTAFLSDSCELTKDLAKAKLRGYSDDMQFQREEMFKRYSSSMEQSLLTSVSTVKTNLTAADTAYWTEANLRTASDANSVSGSLRTTYGYIPILENLGTTYSGAGVISADTNTFKIDAASTSYADFIKYDEVIYDKRNNAESVDFIGRGALTLLAQKIVDPDANFTWKGQVSLGSPQMMLKLGFKSLELNTIHGTHNLTPTRSLRNQYNNYWLVPNYENVGIAQFEADQYLNNVKTDNDYEGVKDVIKSKKGLFMTLLKTHHMIVLR